MTIKTLWYLSMADGRYPWMPDGFFGADQQRYRELTTTIDQGGFYGALVATWPNDPLVSASSVAGLTRHMKFLVAAYAGMTPAKLLAEQALTFEHFNGPRLLFNHINGREERARTYALTAPSADRYRLGEDYWREFQAHYRAGNPSLFPNTAFALAAQQPAGVPLWGTGESDAGVQHAGNVVDGYLLMARELHIIKALMARADASAAGHGRQFADRGVLASVTVRPSAAQARKDFYGLFQATGVDLLRSKLEAVVKRRTQGQHTLASFRAPDPQRQEWIDCLLAGRLPPLESLRLEHNLYAGLTAWSSLDIFASGSSAAYLVGDPHSLAEDIERYHRQAGISAWILSGWPLAEEARQVSALLLPLIQQIDTVT
ncbi:LLM class flavin-dependent oxidoreductase [Pseudomonas putida]